uniref:GLOBIN domain-containing protein n=1 Tax=Elaeophora elaphi TaxID=1147741 RepID=A0A0R3RLL6_9BILA
MGSKGSKLRRSKSTGSKKSVVESAAQQIIPSKAKTSDFTGCTDNLLNVGRLVRKVDHGLGSIWIKWTDESDFGIRAGNSSRSSLDLTVNRSRSGSICSSRSISKQKHPIPMRDRNLIQSCFQNSHEILGHKILQRAYEKRNGFANFYAKLSSDEREDIEEGIKQLLKKTVANINFLNEIQRIAEDFGGKHVKFRALGFKPEFFGAYADATITECIFLDNAIHPAHQTLAAFSLFITMVFSSVRDGFYGEMRRMRRASNSFSTGSNSSYMKKTVSGDLGSDLPQRSASPDNDSGRSDISAVIVVPVDNDSLAKPPSYDP